MRPLADISFILCFSFQRIHRYIKRSLSICYWKKIILRFSDIQKKKHSRPVKWKKFPMRGRYFMYTVWELCRWILICLIGVFMCVSHGNSHHAYRNQKVHMILTKINQKRWANNLHDFRCDCIEITTTKIDPIILINVY